MDSCMGSLDISPIWNIQMSRDIEEVISRNIM
jgi:hypothetical protein